MTYTTHIPIGRSGTARLGDAAARITRTAVATLAAAYAEHRTRRALLELDDHMLKDVGLSRSEIDRVARTLSRR